MRLTKRLDDGQAVMDCENCELKQTNNCHLLLCRNRLKDQLARYEDIANSPENLKVKGEWKWNEYGQMYCSVCGEYPELAIEKPFCSMCGADMKGEKNEST